MYRPSQYEFSDVSLKRFAKQFNSEESYDYIKIFPIESETFVDDGQIVNEKTGQSIGFDWEIRDKYFNNGVFPFKTLGQFERKIKKPSIELSIQADTNETAILIGWHDDWKKEKLVRRKCSTDKNDVDDSLRYTSHFKLYTYSGKNSQLSEFKAMLDRAFATGKFDHSAF